MCSSRRAAGAGAGEQQDKESSRIRRAAGAGEQQEQESSRSRSRGRSRSKAGAESGTEAGLVAGGAGCGRRKQAACPVSLLPEQPLPGHDPLVSHGAVDSMTPPV